MPSPYSLPLHTLRLAGRCALPLILWFAAGQVVRFALLYGATEIAYGDLRQLRLMGTVTFLTLIVLAVMTVTTGMLFTLRGALWEMRARRGEGVEDERFFRVLDRVAPAFAVLYLSWGWHVEDARAVQRMDLNHHYYDMTSASWFGEETQVGKGLTDLDWRVSLGAMVVLFGLKWLFAKLVEQGKGRLYGFGAAFSEFAFVFYGLNATVAIAGLRSDWVEHRSVVAGTEDLMEQARKSVPLWETVSGVVSDFWPYFLDAVAVPLAWLTVAMLVFGSYSDETRSLVKGTRFERGVDRLEDSHDLTQRSFDQLTGGFRDRWLPLANSLRMIAKAGAPLFGMMCLCYVTVTLAGQYAERLVVTLVGSQAEWTWAYKQAPVMFLRDMFVTVLTMALMAATYDLAATRARLKGEPLSDV
ncbi:hypothetical protein ACFFV7_40355 [Nonomuraea spiralis]|uniref:ABC transmembrane type-1 domain-containing protein n=1 Tax=Nonomuraea spiralis TaxID=46182 RepID=A0ABV5ISF3_9ACTN|nr:hypothetical protein [Nonomuraea spiralis]GGT39952.1 hypothetical protein GCM10010176_099860 [Nonomuraea spiralis]